VESYGKRSERSLEKGAVMDQGVSSASASWWKQKHFRFLDLSRFSHLIVMYQEIRRIGFLPTNEVIRHRALSEGMNDDGSHMGNVLYQYHFTNLALLFNLRVYFFRF